MEFLSRVVNNTLEKMFSKLPGKRLINDRTPQTITGPPTTVNRNTHPSPSHAIRQSVHPPMTQLNHPPTAGLNHPPMSVKVSQPISQPINSFPPLTNGGGLEHSHARNPKHPSMPTVENPQAAPQTIKASSLSSINPISRLTTSPFPSPTTLQPYYPPMSAVGNVQTTSQAITDSHKPKSTGLIVLGETSPSPYPAIRQPEHSSEIALQDSIAPNLFDYMKANDISNFFYEPA